MTFTEQAKDQAQASWQGSFQHPFITELHEGTLSPTIFRYYLIQDHYYLKHFSQLYRLIAAQTQQPRLKKLLLTLHQPLITMFLICIANLLKERLRRPQQVCCLVLGSIKKLVHS